MDNDKLNGEVKVDESYFGARKVRRKRGRGAKGKTPVVGLLKRQGQVYTQVITNCQRKELMPVIKGNEFARGKNHVNGIESFWSYPKRRLLKFNGIHKEKFLLHLKESELRWNMRINRVNMCQELLKNFREKSL